MQSPLLFRTAVSLCIIAAFATIRITPATAQQNIYRNITITALADRELLENDAEKTERDIKKIIAFVSDVFKKEFGAALELQAVKPWQFPYGKTELNAYDALTNVNALARGNKDSDITVGFTKKKLSGCLRKTDNEVGGCAFILGNAAVTHFNKPTVLHEIGHLFGAKDNQDPLSIMYEGYNTNENFDDTNKAIIRQNIQEKFLIPNAP